MEPATIETNPPPPDATSNSEPASVTPATVPQMTERNGASTPTDAEMREELPLDAPGSKPTLVATSSKPPSITVTSADKTAADTEEENSDDESGDGIDEGEEAAKGKKRGQKGRFKDEQAEFFGSFLERYRQLQEINDEAEKNKALAVFWHDVSIAYYAKFTWRDARAQLGAGWEKASKNKVLGFMRRTAIKSFYRNRVKPPTTRTNGYWKKVLAPPAKTEGPVPQLTTAWQVYSSMESDRVSEEMRRQDPNGNLSDIAWRNKVARALFENETNERKQQVAQEAERLKVEKMIAFGNAQEKLGMDVNSDMQLAGPLQAWQERFL
ncbi:hypothetical protein K474DRAFT_1713998 [Panus rudis PR-1116 ss-1]|nr:hypothetical protein K474DRAFT_1713998 [Panus rudis PR-1116 ss-1]